MSITTKNNLNRLKLYVTALDALGTDVSPKDKAPDDLACAETAFNMIDKVVPGAIKGSLSTLELFKQMDASPKFRRVLTFRPGTIIISPTPLGIQPGILTNGHVGIVVDNEEIVSNDSATGNLLQNYTVSSWVARYRDKGKYKIYCFELI